MAASRAAGPKAQSMAAAARRALLARKASLAGRADGAAEVAELDAALRRLDDGTWGVCVECGGAIGRTRLLAMPEATTCLSCARPGKGGSSVAS